MQSFISTWAVSITVAIMLSAIISALLPESGIKKYVSVVLGLVVTIIMLAPVIKLFSGLNVQDELKDAFGTINSGEVFKYDGARYKDYIYELYEVYISDDPNKHE